MQGEIVGWIILSSNMVFMLCIFHIIINIDFHGSHKNVKAETKGAHLFEYDKTTTIETSNVACGDFRLTYPAATDVARKLISCCYKITTGRTHTIVFANFAFKYECNMKKILVICFLAAAVQAVGQSTISVADLWATYRFYQSGIDDLRSLNNGSQYTLNVDGTSIEKFDYENGKSAGEMFNVSQTGGAIANFADYKFNDDETAILLTTEMKPRYRHATYDENYVFEIATKKTTRLSERGLQMYADFAPKGNKIAYVIDNNLFYKDLTTNNEVQITNDGKWNYIINGGSDWVYEEEFALIRSFEWSPNGDMIAFYKFDESEVPQFDMMTYKGQLYPENYEFKYPKVGERNSKVEIYIYNIKTNGITRVNINKDYEYIPRIKWNNDGSGLVITTLNRLQNDLELFIADPVSGNTRSLFQEKATYYLEINDDLTFLKDNKSFIWRSEMDGYAHLYLYDMQGKLVNRITSGNFEVTEVLGVDETAKVVYYMSTEESPFERHLYAVSLDGKKKTKITTRFGANQVDFSKGFKYFINTNSTFMQPSYITLCDNKGKEIRVLEENIELIEEIKSLDIAAPEMFSFTTSEGVSLNGYMIKPDDFDPKKKYPVFMTVYGGPGSQEVIQGYDGFNMMWHQMLAQKGYIIVCVDNRGTGGRGRDFRQVTYGQLGKYETDDQIEAAKYLAKQPYVDGARIGIWGWSYGGYMAGLCITRGADVFKMAISVAPVTNWKYYDNIYTERYMGTLQSNPNGFDANAPMAFADKLKGNLLLVHGTGDDNVHFQNSVEFINALVKNNKQFDLMIYPDRNHGIYGGSTRMHLYTLMTDYILENL